MHYIEQLNILASFCTLLHPLNKPHMPWYTVRWQMCLGIKLSWIWSWADINRNCNIFLVDLTFKILIIGPVNTILEPVKIGKVRTKTCCQNSSSILHCLYKQFQILWLVYLPVPWEVSFLHRKAQECIWLSWDDLQLFWRTCDGSILARTIKATW